MNRKELVNYMAESADLTVHQAGAALDAFIKAVETVLGNAELDPKEKNVTLVGFGVFCVQERKSRKFYNPQTGEKVEVSDRSVPVFKVGRSLKAAVS